MENVSWKNAQEFIGRLNAMTGKTFRLPTEAEWEYAARGGHKSKHYKYSGSNQVSEVAWYVGNSSGGQYGEAGTTRPVGLKKSNELGLYDMSGNVWEWCGDLYTKEYKQGGKSIHPGWPFEGTKSAAVHYRLKLLAAYLLALNKRACDCVEPVNMLFENILGSAVSRGDNAVD